MNPAIVVLKVDLQKHAHLGQQLSSLSERVSEWPEECRYYPKSGNLVDFMRILLKYDLDYRLEYVDE